MLHWTGAAGVSSYRLRTSETQQLPNATSSVIYVYSC